MFWFSAGIVTTAAMDGLSLERSSWPEESCNEDDSNLSLTLMQRRATSFMENVQQEPGSNVTSPRHGGSGLLKASSGEASPHWTVLNVSLGANSPHWTGRVCLLYSCPKDMGPVECHTVHCYCMTGTFFNKDSQQCEQYGLGHYDRQTSWTCHWWNFNSHCEHVPPEGSSVCSAATSKCFCKVGWRAVGDFHTSHCERVPDISTTTTTTSFASKFGYLSNTEKPKPLHDGCEGLGAKCNAKDMQCPRCCDAGLACLEKDAKTSYCTNVTKSTRIPLIPFHSKLSKPSNAPLHTFYMYRAQGPTSYPPESSNAANLEGVMFYLHNEIVSHHYVKDKDGKFTRKFGITRILRYKVQTRATQTLHELGMNFGVRYAFDSGQCTGPWSCDDAFQNYGFFVGCNNFQDNFPFPTGETAYKDGIWYSVPGKCPQHAKRWEMTKDDLEDCIQKFPGGVCPSPGMEPTGQGDCTFNYEEPVEEIDLDELTGISGGLHNWVFAGNKEFDTGRDAGIGMSFWDKRHDRSKAQERVRRVEALFDSKYPKAQGIEVAPCDFNKYAFFHRAPGGYGCSAAAPASCAQYQCSGYRPHQPCQ